MAQRRQKEKRIKKKSQQSRKVLFFVSGDFVSVSIAIRSGRPKRGRKGSCGGNALSGEDDGGG